MSSQIRIGWASTSITPDRPVFIAGQMYPRISSYVHDPITATALAIENGEDQMTMVSLDMVNVPRTVCDKFRSKLKDIPDLDVSKISFNGTHTHNSLRGIEDPYRNNFEHYLGLEKITCFDMPDDILYGDDESDFLANRVYQIIKDAWTSRKEGSIAFAHDYAAIAFNRRPVFKNPDSTEQSIMYGCCSKENFVKMEGPSDHSVEMLFTFDDKRSLTGAAINIPCPSQVHELHRYISADYWTEVRGQVREKLGNINILPLCGAAGDQNPLDLIKISKTNEKELELWNAQAGEVFRNLDMGEICRGIGERVSDCVARGLRKAVNAIESYPVLNHRIINLSMPIRKVTADDYKQALEAIDKARSSFSAEHKMTSEDMVKVFEPIGIARRWELQNAKPMFNFSCHVIRLGTASIATNPFELFTEYGLRMKARCHALQLFIVQLCDDAGVYLPTQTAINGGSYSSKPASTIVGPKQGEKLVEAILEEEKEIWNC